MNISALGERKIIEVVHEIIEKKLNFKPDYDDSAFIRLPSSDYLVLHTDVLNESTDFIKEMGFYNFGWKAVISNLSDIACKGAKPLGILFSFSLPKSLDLKDFEEMIKGICDACKEEDVIYLGGDTSSSNELSIAGFAFGIAKRIIKRKGAKIGDLIGVTGKFGLNSIAYEILFKKAKSDEYIKNLSLSNLFKPKGRIKEALMISPYLNCCMDISDGLAISLNQLCELNNVGARIFNIPIHEKVNEFCEINNLDPLELSLYKGGEEYEILFCFNESYLEDIKNLLTSLKCEFNVIGEITKNKEVIYNDGKRNFVIESKGWEHFKQWG